MSADDPDRSIGTRHGLCHHKLDEIGSEDVDYNYQICPACDEEFTLSVVECAHCGVALVSPGDRPPEDPSEEFPDTDELDCVRVGPLPWTRALSEQLSAAGIAHRVQPDNRTEEEGGVDRSRFGGEDLYGTWVEPEDLDAAQAIDAAIFAPLEADMSQEAQEGETCPACGASLATDSMECPECGLSFG